MGRTHRWATSGDFGPFVGIAGVQRSFEFRVSGQSHALWEGRFKACLVQDTEYLLHCYRYIELNPVRAGIVADPVDYRWSSYRVTARGVESDLCTPHPEYRALREWPGRRSAYRDLFTAHVEDELIENIREAAERSSALGDDRFIR